MTRKLVLAPTVAGLLAGAVLWQGCSGPERPAGDSWLPVLADGVFLDAGNWIDFRQRHQEIAQTRSILPPTFLATVESGWGGTESWGGWGVGERTEFRFFLRRSAASELALTCRAARHPDGRSQTVTATVNGRKIGTFEAGRKWREKRLEIPAGVLRTGDNRLSLGYAFHLGGDERDPRPLALAIERVGLLEPGRSMEPAGKGLEVDKEGDALSLGRTGTFLVPVRVPGEARALELSVRTRGRGASFGAGVLSLDGGEEDVPPPADGRLRIDLEAYHGREVFLLFDADLPAGGRIELRFPRLMADGPGDAGVAPTSDGSRPDVVMIVLDAARPDHFGVYGYHRDTTPVIDRLAAESLAFRNVVSECSYTACSMPNLLAGLSFWQHGLVLQGQRLGDEVQTLAEMLSELGYLTLGFTGNPNSSRMTGSDQGFDEFHEIWRVASGRDRTHPGFLTERVIERLERDLDERPVFLMTHYVPPHEPYDPDPRFDLFGDPAYAGPVTGEQSFVGAVFAHEIELDAADLAELVALYDGNLRMADHAVGRLIEALQRLGRWRDTLLVLTSDHGEAFAEHGHLGHNSTIHEEMLRVPLILRLPRGERVDTDLDRLASLGDLVPTILGRLGQPVPPPTRGADLLAPAPAPISDRLVFLRSAEEGGTIFGVRTPRWKLMAWAPVARRGGWIRLFDLMQDAAESRDLAAEHRLLQAALAQRLERVLRGRPDPVAGGREAEISKEEEDMLRSLGYL
ncbi:MAG: sulfatase [bacterium]|nr:sulfatase [bacterium]